MCPFCSEGLGVQICIVQTIATCDKAEVLTVAVFLQIPCYLHATCFSHQGEFKSIEHTLLPTRLLICSIPVSILVSNTLFCLQYCYTVACNIYIYTHTHIHIYIYIYISFKTFFFVVRHLDSIASYLPTGRHLGFFRSWPSLYLPSSFTSVFLVLPFVSASTSMLFWVIFLLPFSEHGRTI